MPLPNITSCMIGSAQRQIVSFALFVKCVDRYSKTGIPVFFLRETYSAQYFCVIDVVE